MAIQYHPKGKSRPSHSVGGFLSNLGSGLRNDLVGIVEAPYYIGRAGIHDIQHGNHAETGAMLAGIWSQLKDYYGPALHGDIKGFAQNVYDRPDQLGLDILTALTGGAGLAAKGATLAARGAEAGGMAARAARAIAGLEHIDHAAYDALSPAAKAKAVRLAPGEGALVPGKHQIVNSVGKVVHEYDKSPNAMVRGRQALKEKVLEATGGSNTLPGRLTNGYFHPDRRGVRLAQATEKRVARREAESSIVDAMKALSKLPKEARTALFYRLPGFNTESRLNALVKHRLDGLDEVMSSPTPRDKAHIEEDLKRLSDPKVRESILNPDEKTLAVEQKLLDASDKVQVHRALRGAPGDPVERAAQPLRTIGIEPAPGERLGIVSYSQHRLPRALRRSKVGGVRAGGGLASDLASTGTAFQHGLYDADPRKVLHSMMDEVHLKRSAHDLEYALAISRPYVGEDGTIPADIAHGVANGTLKAFTVDSAPIKALHEIANFVDERVLPLAKDAAPEEAAAFEQQAAILREWTKEAEDAGARGMVMPMSSWNDLTAQVEAASGLYAKLLKTPTRLWRDLTLSLKGSFYVNNFLGNLLLGLIAHPIAFAPALVRHGFSSTSSLGKRIDEVAPDLARSGQAATLAKLSHADLPVNASRLNPLNLLSMAADKVAHVGGLFTESNFRRAAMAVEVNQTARRLMRGTPGMKHADAVDLLLNDAQSVDAMAAKVYHDLLDYSKLTPFEKDYIRPLLPFWNFTRSIAGRAITLTLDEPWKVQVLKAMSETAMRENDQHVFANIKGELPPYLDGLMQVGPTHDGITPVASTYAANPFSSVADTASQLSSLVTGDATDTQSPLAQFNPYIRSALEAATGRDLFFDKPLQGSRGHIFLTQLANNFPQVATYNRVRYPGASPYLERSLQQSGLQYMGLPVADFNERNAIRNLSIASYYDQLARVQQDKYVAKRASRDRGRFLGLTG